MTPYQIFALDQFLSDYPDEHFDAVIQMVADEEGITPLPDYQDFFGGTLAYLIERLADKLARDFIYKGD